jgi:arabinosaccharide transport system substrate-binding protein
MIVGRKLLSVAAVIWLVAACGSTATPAPTPPPATPPPATAPAIATATPVTTPAPANATNFTFWTFVDRHATWWHTRQNEWNATHPDRPVNLTSTVTEYNQMHDNLTAALASGTGAPEIVDVEISKFGNYTKGTIHLLDLTAEVAPYKADLIASRLAPYQASGKQLGIDYHLGAVLAFYNADIMKKAGVDPASIKTWDDYIAAGKKVQAAVPGVTFSVIDTNDIHPAATLMREAGGGLYDSSQKVSLNSAGTIEALTLINQMVNVDKIATGTPGGNSFTPEAYAAWQAGKIASIWMPQWFMTRFTDNMPALCGKMVIEPMPTFTDSTRATNTFTTTMGGGTGTAVTDQTPAADQQLAKDFVTWAKLTKDGQESGWINLGFDPYRPDVYADPALLTPDACFSGQITFSIIKSELGNVAPEYTGDQLPAIVDYMKTTLLSDVISGKTTPTDAANAAQTQFATTP